MFLPTLEQAQRIVAANDAFQTSTTEINGYTLHHFGYSLPGYQDFEDPIPGSGLQAHELRGLTFVESPDGKVTRYLLLRKFHTLDGTIGHMLADLVDKPVLNCTVKLDGSLVRFIPLGDQMTARSMKSFRGPHVQMANILLQSDPNLESFVRRAHAMGLAPAFELVSPVKKIVLDYPDDYLHLLQMRDETSGEYLDLDTHPLVAEYGIATATVPGVRTLRDLLDRQAQGRNIEGWVLRYADNMVKVKTPWFEDIHDFVFERRHTDKKLLEMVVNDTLEDGISRLGNDDPILARAKLVLDVSGPYLLDTAEKITRAVDSFPGSLDDGMARKNFTQAYKGDPLLGLYMQALKNPLTYSAIDMAKQTVRKACKRENDAQDMIEHMIEHSNAFVSVPGCP